MADLETRLRAEVTRRAQELAPSADLPERIRARVQRRRRQRQVLAGAVSTGVAAVIVLALILARPSEEGSVRMNGDRETTTSSTTTSSTTSTSTSTTASTNGSTATTAEQPGTTTTSAGPPQTTSTTTGSAPAIGPDTPLTRTGIGPIRAGMTLREAEAAAGVTITPGETMGPGSTCGTANIDGLDLWLMVSLSGQPGEDPMDGVVRSVQGGRRTIEGLALGDPVDDVAATYGPPTRTLDYPYLPNGQVFVYESGGYAYSATTDGSTVVELESGDRDWVANLEGCA